MKSYSTLLVALGLVSSTVLAQSNQSAPQPSSATGAESSGSSVGSSGSSVGSKPEEATQMPAPTMNSGSQAPTSGENGGAMSSGASAAGTSMSESTGQLITPDIAQSHPASESTGVAVKPQTDNGVTYLCGGVGDDESAYMKKTAAKDYDLMMTFAEKSGDYVANVDVSIKDARGKTVLNTKCDGPMLLVDFPAGGNYRIRADAGGHTLDRTAAVKSGKGHVREVRFVWPAGVATAAKKGGGHGMESSGGDNEGGGNSGSDSSGENGGKGSSGENMR